MIRDDGRMIACAGPDRRAGARWQGERFDVVGFGGVIVTRTRRGQGLARRVMEAAIARAAELGPERGLLFCRPDRAGLYAGLGFVKVDVPVEVGQLDGKRAAMPLDTMWRPLRPGATWPDGAGQPARPAVLTLTRSAAARRRRRAPPSCSSASTASSTPGRDRAPLGQQLVEDLRRRAQAVRRRAAST